MSKIIVDENSKRQLYELKNLLLSKESFEQKEYLLSKLSKEGKTGYVEALYKDVRGMLGLPPELDTFIFVVNADFTNIPAQDLLCVLMKNIDVMLAGIWPGTIFSMKLQYFDFEGQRYRVNVVFKEDYVVSVYETLDQPHRYFAEFFYGGHAIYSKDREIKVDKDLFSKNSRSEILEFLSSLRP